MSGHHQSDPQRALIKPLSQIQAWIIECLEYTSFSQLNHNDRVDLWPFFTSSILDNCMPLEDLRRHMVDNIVAAMEICGLPTISCQANRDEDDEVPDRAVLFHHLMHHIPVLLADTTLLGRYAISGERYAAALLCTSRYILRLPKDQLGAICNDDLSQLSNSTVVAWRTFSHCINHLPLSTELYFFVLYMFSVIVAHRQIDNKSVDMAASAYLFLVSTARTFC